MNDVVEQVLSPTQSIPAQLAKALNVHADLPALVDGELELSYGQLAHCVEQLQPSLPENGAVAVFGKPSVTFAVGAFACVVLGQPFVHLDPAMPADVLTNIIDELNVETIFQCEAPQDGQLPTQCHCIDVMQIVAQAETAPHAPIEAPRVAPDAPIYIVATSGSTGKPKCIPVSQQSAYLSYEWRYAYTPYDPSETVGVYIFAIWEMFRPLRDGAKVCFPRFSELMNPDGLMAFLKRHAVTEMLFTPSALETTLRTCDAALARDVVLKRIILNGEVVSAELIAAVRDKLPNVKLWNLYSICETHDISMTEIMVDQPAAKAGSVGIPMPHLRAVVLDDNDNLCNVGEPGLLHFEGPQMLGPGYINREEETALRFRELEVNGVQARLYDTGDQGYVAEDGSVHVMGRIAHMLKLRGHSIQTRELMESLRSYIGFTQAVPWIKSVTGQGDALVFYYCTDDEQQRVNGETWALEQGESRMPLALSKALRSELPAYCIPSYLVQLDEIPVNAVSGKCDHKRLPDISHRAEESVGDQDNLLTVVHAAKVMGCDPALLDPALSFHDQGGDSLMAVDLLGALEAAYDARVDFDFALNVPLGRLDEILRETDAAPKVQGTFERTGILLTGVTGFLGSRVVAALLDTLPAGEAVYCLVRSKRRDHVARLEAVAEAQGIDAARLIAVPAAIEDANFNLSDGDYHALAQKVRSVIHCAAMVNLAVDPEHMLDWSRAGITNVLKFCTASNADLRFSSSSAVFADIGGPYAETATSAYAHCSGYGAAKIEAEALIAASGVPAAIVRLPSLYDLEAPNGKDIYEIIVKACAEMRAIPEGFAFRMIDVHAAARFLGSVPRSDGAHYYNFAPEHFDVASNIEGLGIDVRPLTDWLRDAPLTQAEKALIKADLSVLKADAVLSNAHAEDMWGRVTGEPLSNISQPRDLLARRLRMH
ncbi:AMP-binding protein [Planktotalea sp.]|uniref:AMP-binding protein n=1 Tax=Planktotalea sp. TaxID=2029877 RepID=UPI003299EFC7